MLHRLFFFFFNAWEQGTSNTFISRHIQYIVEIKSEGIETVQGIISAQKVLAASSSSEQPVAFRSSCAKDCDDFALPEQRVLKPLGSTQMIRTVPLGNNPTLSFIGCVTWASYLSFASHLPITFLVQKAHLLRPKLLVALVLVDAVAAT